MRSKKINYSMKISDVDIINHKIHPIYILRNKRDRLIENNIIKYPSIAPVINALALGEKNFSDETNDIISQTGTNHLFAISGTHLIIVILMIEFIIGNLNIGSLLGKIIKNLTLLLFMFLAGGSYPIMRATFVSIITDLFKLNKFESTFLVFISFFIINPFCLSNIGFILTFYISFIIPKIIDIMEKINFKLHNTIVFSYLIYFAVLPISLNLSNSINLFSPFATLISSIVISFILLPSSIIMTFIHFSFLIPKIYELTVNLLSIVLNNLSYYNIIVPHIPILLIFILLSMLFSFYSTFKYKYIYLYSLILIIVIFNLNIFGSVSVIDIGQGDSILVQYPLKGEKILIDTGPPDSELELISFLKYEGINKIDTVILTHQHLDHYGNIDKLNNTFKIDNIYSTGNEGVLPSDTKIISSVNEGKTFGNFKILLTNSNDDNENNNSLTFTLKTGNEYWFFGGDIEEEKESNILKYKDDLSNVDYYKVNHHGSKSSSSGDFINALNAKYGIISCGKNNFYNHPNEEVLDTLKSNNMKIHITSEDGIFIYKFLGPIHFIK